jgi:hypothetical protein
MELDFNIKNYIETKHYIVYITGKIYSKTHKKFLKQAVHKQKKTFYFFNADDHFTFKTLARYIYETFYGVKLDRKKIVAHIDGNRLNCQLTNLKVITKQEANFEQNKYIKKKKGYNYIGVHLNTSTGNYITNYRNVEGKVTYLGSFKTFEDACDCYDFVAKEWNKLLGWDRYPLNNIKRPEPKYVI